MAWPNGVRLKTFAAGGTFLPADANAIEDRMLQIAGYAGATNITTEEARTNVAYGTLTTPDQVTGIVMPTDGLICVAFQAMWKESVVGAARAAIFIGTNQLKLASNSAAAPVVQETAHGAPSSIYKPLTSATFGLDGSSGSGTAYTGDVTTGQVLGGTSSGYVSVFAAAGTYDVSVKFNATSGSVTAKNRVLRVWTKAFA